MEASTFAIPGLTMHVILPALSLSSLSFSAFPAIVDHFLIGAVHF